MVTDFFYPSTGGVEHHVYQLARCLKEQGHKVVVVTHRYGTWSGVHRLSGDLKVYYLPLDPMHNGSLPPTAVRLLPHLHDIFVREAFQESQCATAPAAVRCVLRIYKIANSSPYL